MTLMCGILTGLTSEAQSHLQIPKVSPLSDNKLMQNE